MEDYANGYFFLDFDRYSPSDVDLVRLRRINTILGAIIEDHGGTVPEDFCCLDLAGGLHGYTPEDLQYAIDLADADLRLDSATI